MTDKRKRGSSFPLGATVSRDGVNFSVYSKTAMAIQLLFFQNANDHAPERTIQFAPQRNRTGNYWHAFVPGVKPGQLYGYRAHGPFDPTQGHRFDPEKVLLDPYGKCVAPGDYQRSNAGSPGDTASCCMKSVVVDLSAYDWEGDLPLRRPFSETIIYELHVGGFTGHASSGVQIEKRGTYSGLIEKIPYLQNLGITAVELLPVFQFDAQDSPAGLSNYWGYSPVSFFSPHIGYSSWSDPLKSLQEFRDMVKALHQAGIEVILDVVYNHTAEGNEAGPTFCYRGFDNSVYYILNDADKSRYNDYSGCGNTLNANQSIVRRMILDSVHYWVSSMHVDGFRFDLASILSRDEAGCPMMNAPVLSDLESDPVLAGTKLIAEAWDTQLYQLGSFAGGNWKEWNGKFRDHIRGFMKADPGTVATFANRVIGSPDIFYSSNGAPEKSINFVTCHDGFTLNDLVSYDQKHNHSNGEDNRDGSDNNLSWNCGAEGPTDDRLIQEIRTRQVKHFFTVTLLATGIPMILMGDEIRRTQCGNNNAYCQNNELGWFDWRLLDTHAEILRFVRYLTLLRLKIYANQKERDSHGESFPRVTIQWHGVKLNEPDWSDHSHCIAATVENIRNLRLNHFIFNSYWEPLEFQLPPIVPEKKWHLLIDTSLPSPSDILEPKDALPIEGSAYLVAARSTVMLFAK